jgi:type II secretory pathway pseudopilin PulG
LVVVIAIVGLLALLSVPVQRARVAAIRTSDK